MGVDMFACARAACAVSASAATPRSRTAGALLSDAVVADARASPVHSARNSTACTIREDMITEMRGADFIFRMH